MVRYNLVNRISRNYNITCAKIYDDDDHHVLFLATVTRHYRSELSTLVRPNYRANKKRKFYVQIDILPEFL